jgi:glyoxylase-like metal-dependent hydrolase (beta-lactamase superfamily II)
MHPNWKLHAAHPPDLDETIEVALLSGVPQEPLERWAEKRRSQGSGQAGTLYADRDLVPGVTIETDAGVWQVIETPGHAPSHVCLHQPEQRLLISGNHLLGRVSQYFDVGYTPDPVGEFLHSLDVTEALDARLALAGHARPFTEVPGHIQANRDLIARNLGAVRAALGAGEKTAYETARTVYGEQFTEELASWQMTMTTAWLTHLERLGEVGKTADGVEHWHLAS